jgi:hypothetical protein
MKKALTILTILMLSSFLAFADDSRFYTLNATTNVGTGSSQYRFNYTTVYDLSDHFTGRYGTTPIYGDYASQSHPERTLNQSRALGTVGVAACEHKIKYTITALDQGRFVSQSDPSKYRNYYVVIVPDKGDANGTARNFYYPGNDSETSYAPSTKNGPIEFETVVTRTTTSSWGWGGYTTTTTDISMGLDLFLCMDELTDADLMHLAQNDDYYATIRVEWQCTVSSCSENHSGSFDITVRGYYGSTQNAYDSIFLLLEPTTESTKINIKKVAMTHSTVDIATFKINTVTKEEFNWQNHLFAFLSASSDYSVSDNNGFILKKMGDSSTTIPYTLTVYNTTNGVISENKKVYDGRNYFTNAASARSFCLDLTDYTKTSVDSFRDTYNAINYEGKVEMKLNDFAIPGSGNDFAAVMNNPSASESYLLDYQNYIGKYESQIYYHVVYTD